jgi:hypothetical protein
MAELSKSAAAKATAAALRREAKPEKLAVELIYNARGTAFLSRNVRLPKPLRKGVLVVHNRYDPLTLLVPDSDDKEDEAAAAVVGDGDIPAEVDGAAEGHGAAEGDYDVYYAGADGGDAYYAAAAGNGDAYYAAAGHGDAYYSAAAGSGGGAAAAASGDDAHAEDVAAGDAVEGDAEAACSE